MNFQYKFSFISFHRYEDRFDLSLPARSVFTESNSQRTHYAFVFIYSSIAALEDVLWNHSQAYDCLS